MAVPGFVISGVINIAIGLIGRYLFRPDIPDQTIVGPRLSDLSVTSSAYGTALNVADGTIRLNGTVIYAGDGIIEEVIIETEEVGGKGAPSATITSINFRYYLDWAIVYAVGVAEELLRMWADGKLIYDRTGKNTITKHNIRFYVGDEEQLPDPMIEAFIDAKYGAGSTPAYRGSCYTAIQRMALADYANRPPNLTAEITFAAGATYPRDDLVELTGGILGGDIYWLYDPYNDFMIATDEGDLTIINDDSFVVLDEYSNFPGDNGGICVLSDGTAVSINTSTTDITKLDLATFTTLGSFSQTPEYFGLGWWCDYSVPIVLNGVIVAEIVVFGGLGGQVAVLDGKNMVAQNLDVDLWETISGGDLSLTPEPVNNTPLTDTERGYIYLWSNWSTGATDPDKQVLWRFRWDGTWDEEGAGDTNGSQYDGGQFGLIIEEVGRWTKAQLFEINGVGASAVGGACLLLSENAMIVSPGPKARGDSNSRLTKIDLETGTIVVGPVDTTAYGSFVGFNHKVYGNRFSYVHKWNGIATISTVDLSLIKDHDAADDIGLTEAAGDAFDGQFWYDEGRDAIIVDRTFAGGPTDEPKRTRIYLGRATGGGVGLDYVQNRYIQRTGLYTDADVDVTALAGITVEGNALARPGMSAVEASQILQQAYRYVLIEEDWKLKAVLYGGAAAVTIPQDDIGRARTSDQSDPALVRRRTQIVELPETVEVSHSDRAQDYSQNVEFQKRISLPVPTMSSRDTIRIDLGPLVMPPDEAKQLADKWLYTWWQEREGVDSELPWKYLPYSVADVVNLVTENETLRVRLEEIEIGAELPMSFKSVLEDAVTSQSTEVANTEGNHITGGNPSGSGGPSRAVIADAPVLLATDDTGGTTLRSYVGLSGFGDPDWPGSNLLRSVDSGATWAAVSAGVLPVAWGHVVTAPTDWDAIENNIFQEVTDGGTVRVMMRDRGDDLSTTTEDDILTLNANAAMIIAPTGEVEILSFQTVTNVETDTYDLTRLLRGRRGTEDVANGGLIVAGSTFVLLEAAPINRLTTELTYLNQGVLYRAVTVGADVNSGVTFSFVDTGRDLRPYAPVHLDALVDENLGLTATWTRRTRFNGQWNPLTGTVPLNEVSEEYTAVLDTGTTRTTKVVTSPTAAFTKAEVEADGAGTTGSATLLDDFGSVPTSNGWTAIGAGSSSAPASQGNISGPPGASGNGTFGLRTGATMSTRYGWSKQFELTASTTFTSTTDWADGTSAVTVRCWIAADDVSEGTADITVNVLDDEGNTLATYSKTGIALAVNGTWEQHAVNCPLVPEAYALEVELAFTNTSGTSADFGFDVLETLTYVPPSGIILEVTQNSGVPGIAGVTAVETVT